MKSQTSIPPRSRWRLAGLGVVTVAAGLATRWLRSVIAPALAEFLGDALYATLVYWLIAWLGPRQSGIRIALLAWSVSAGVEFSQLLHAPLLESLRQTALGGLILGWGFAWGDLVAYSIGVFVCLLLERYVLSSINARWTRGRLTRSAASGSSQ